MTTTEMIKAVCKDLGISQAELAKRTGQLPSTLSRKLKNGTVSMDEFRQYMTVLNVSCDIDLKYGDGTEWTSKGAEERASERISVLEAKLTAAERDRELKASLSRDIRTSLANALGCIDLSEKNADLPEKHREYLNKAKTALHEIEKYVCWMLGEEYIEESEPITAVDSSALAGMSVLLAEDNMMNREIIRGILSEAGIVSDEAENGKQVLEKLESSPPGNYSAVLMDMEMPVIDGCEATRIIRAQANRIRAGIPIIAITANALPEDRRKAAESGMDSFITKPVNKERLLQELIRFV